MPKAIPGKRYYGGCESGGPRRDAGHRAREDSCSARFANVQPNSGSQANQAVFLALLKPGDTILGMSLAAGGHLTHGATPNMSGKWFNAVQYGVRKEDGLLDYDELAALAHSTSPKLIIAGGSAYPRFIDFRAIPRHRRFGRRVLHGRYGAFRRAGRSRRCIPSPLPHAHVVTTTTHKTLRGPRGGLMLTNHEEIAKKINSAIFPGLQGGPLMHVIAAKAVAFGEALRPDFKTYQQAVVANAKVLAETLVEQGLAIVTGGTDPHLLLVDLRPKNVTGKAAEASLERAHITANKNAIPFDPEKPFITSGIRLGSPAATTRGFGVAEFREVGLMIGEVLDGLAKSNDGSNGLVEQQVGARAKAPLRPLPDLPVTAGRRDGTCAARSVGSLTPRSRIAGPRKTAARFAAGASASVAASVSPPSSACSCASSWWSRPTSAASPSTATSWPAPYGLR